MRTQIAVIRIFLTTMPINYVNYSQKWQLCSKIPLQYESIDMTYVDTSEFVRYIENVTSIFQNGRLRSPESRAKAGRKFSKLYQRIKSSFTFE